MTTEQVYGRNAVREALRGPRGVRELWATERALTAEPWLKETNGVRVQVKPERELTEAIGSRDHQGVLARCEPGQDARGDQRLVARRLPGQQVAEREERHQAEQQGLARHLAGERGQHRRADGDAQCIEADQQPGGGQPDPKVGRDGGDQADDHEFGRPDGEGAQGERPKCEWHAILLVPLMEASILDAARYKKNMLPYNRLLTRSHKCWTSAP